MEVAWEAKLDREVAQRELNRVRLLGLLHRRGQASDALIKPWWREPDERPKSERPYILFPVGYPAPGCQVPAISKKTVDAVSTWLEGG